MKDAPERGSASFLEQRLKINVKGYLARCEIFAA